MEKIKVDYLTALNKIKSIIITEALAKRSNKDRRWYVQKQRNYKPVSRVDLEIINTALWKIGEDLSNVNISNTKENEENSLAAGKTAEEQVRSLTNLIQTRHIYESLGKSSSWMGHRLRDGYRYTPEEIEQINQIIAQISNLLLSMELVRMPKMED